MVRLLLITAFACLLVGCRGSGGIERTMGEPLAPQPVESVELFIGEATPDRPYRTVAIVRGEASTRRFVTLPETEAAAYEALRVFAARAGAEAVVEIQQELLRAGEPVSYEIPADPAPIAVEHTVRMVGRAVIFR